MNKATKIVTKPKAVRKKPAKNLSQELAVALSYDPVSMDTPVVSAIGAQKVARLIKQVARRYGISLAANKQLAAKLAELEEDEVIPCELYREVAEVLKDLDS